MKKLKSIIEDSDSKAGKIFDIAIQVLIIISVLAFSFETLPNLSKTSKEILQIIEIIAVIIFTIEYLLRFYVAKKKLKFIFSFFGIIDLLAILPFYLALGIDLRSIRIVRILRVFRILKLMRYSKAIKRFNRAFEIIREELVLFFVVALILLYFTAVGIYFFEHEAQKEAFSSIFDSLWWAVATLTTVGYGDVYPVTAGGKIFTFIVLMIGLGIIAVPTSLLASALSKARGEEEVEGKE